MTKRTPEPDPFNNPFGKVKLAQAEAPAAPAPPPRRTEKPVALDAEAAMFLEAMGEVAPVKRSKSRAPIAEAPRVDPVQAVNEESESLAQLAELVSGDGPLEIEGSEGQAPGFDPQVMRRLRRGEFARRAQLDLLGLTQEQGRTALEKFMTQARNDGHRCVLVVTRVLKASLPQWLTRGRIARQVLAFCPALPTDGGADAAYVLLRR